MRQEKILLPICQAGDPVLRQEARRLSREEITTPAVQQLIASIKHTVASRDYGVGLAAPQVGQAVALSVIAIKPTPNRPDREPFEQVIINPSIIHWHWPDSGHVGGLRQRRRRAALCAGAALPTGQRPVG